MSLCTGCGDCCRSPHAPVPSIFRLRAAPWRAFVDPRVDRNAFAAMFAVRYNHQPSDYEVHVVASLLHDAERVPEVWEVVEVDETGTQARYHCRVFDEERNVCREWEQRPAICKNYPLAEDVGERLNPEAPLSARCGYNRLIPHRALLPIAGITEAGVDKSGLR